MNESSTVSATFPCCLVFEVSPVYGVVVRKDKLRAILGFFNGIVLY